MWYEDMVIQKSREGQGSVAEAESLGWSIEIDPRKRPNDGAARVLNWLRMEGGRSLWLCARLCPHGSIWYKGEPDEKGAEPPIRERFDIRRLGY